MNRVDYLYTDDSLVRAETVLRRTLGQYARHNRFLYIGLTQQQPEVRFNQHQRRWADGHKWDRMVVIYHARSASLMQKAEERLIRHARQRYDTGRYTCMPLNDIDSRRPQIAAEPNGFWVYVLVQR